MWLIVADAPRAAYGSAAIERGLQDMAWVSARALAHEAVVEHFAAGPLLPMKLFTLFADDERARVHFSARRQALRRALDRVAGRHEWGVRLSGDGQAPPPRRAPRPSSGTQFLLAKKAQREQASRRVEEAGQEADGLFRVLSRHADDAQRRPPVAAAAGARLWLDAAFLVPRARGRAFRAALQRESRRLAGLGFRVTLTGPWPPYNFVETPR
jgi:gas vesicle protein GvpL/GvpF